MGIYTKSQGQIGLRMIKEKDDAAMLFSELRDKEVISIRQCRKLGHVSDIEFDCCKGCIEKIHVPGKGKLCNLFNQEPDCVICFCDIKQIGPDIILVDI